MKFLVALLVLAVAAHAAPTNTINGTIAEPGQFPYLVLIKQSYATVPGRDSFCVGTIISDEYVLTSHVSLLIGDLEDPITLYFGAHDWKVYEEAQVRLQVFFRNVKTFAPPSEPTKDLALIRLPVRLNFNARIQPINLPRWRDVGDDYARQYGVVAGWSAIYEEFSPVEPERFPRYTEVRIQTEEECIYPSDIVRCIERKSIGRFEEGAPIVRNDPDGPRQIAMASGLTFFGGNPRKEIDVYVPLNLYLVWIEKNSNVIIEA